MDRAGANVPRGQFTFNGEITGNPVADFLIGYAGQSQSPEGILPVQFRQRTYAWYVQDEWKASRKLTLSLGLRYDYVGTVDEKNGIQRALRLDRPGGYLFPETPAPVTGREPIPLYTAEKNRFWPRVGIAYRPADGWVVRMGGGVFNNANQMNNLTVFSDPERRASNNYFWNPQNYITFANPFPASGVAAIPPINVVYISPDRVNAYNVQWSASVQRQLSESTVLELAYVGSQASHLDNSRNLNDAPPGSIPLQANRPYPRWGTIRYLASDGKSYYQSMQVRGERRFSRGFSFLVQLHLGAQYRSGLRHQRIAAVYSGRRAESELLRMRARQLRLRLPPPLHHQLPVEHPRANGVAGPAGFRSEELELQRDRHVPVGIPVHGHSVGKYPEHRRRRHSARTMCRGRIPNSTIPIRRAGLTPTRLCG